MSFTNQKILGKDIYKCSKKPKGYVSDYKPKDHQSRTRDIFVNSKQKGMLLFHDLGTGKTCSGIEIIKHLINKPESDFSGGVHIFTTKSIRGSFIQDFCNLCGDPDQLGLYNFYTTNYTKLHTTLPKNLDNSIIYIDEVHNLFNMKANFDDRPSIRKNSINNGDALFNLVENSKNSRVILLSGTPIYNDVKDLWYVMRLVRNNFRVNYDSFINMLYTPRIFKYLEGVISYVEKPKGQYPEVIEMEDVMLDMTSEQLVEYNRAIVKEMHAKGRRMGKSEKQDGNFRLENSLVSQAIGNMVYPIARVDINGLIVKHHSEVYAPIFSEKDQPVNTGDQDFDYNRGFSTWIGKFYKSLLRTGKSLGKFYSPKFANIIHKILLHPGKHMIFSQNKSKHGVYFIHSFLKQCGISSLVYSGDPSLEERIRTLDLFNAENNIWGDKYRVILITKAGLQGISLKETQFCHLVEPQLNESDSTQAIGRCSRLGSHMRLPIENRTVSVWRYFSVTGDLRESTDEKIYSRAISRKLEIDPVLEIMKRSSVDCELSSQLKLKGCKFKISKYINESDGDESDGDESDGDESDGDESDGDESDGDESE
jgi:superfamily II DNA or RNA helicase